MSAARIVLTSREVADMLGIRDLGLLPAMGIPRVPIGKRLWRYRLVDVEKWLADSAGPSAFGCVSQVDFGRAA